MSVPREDRAGWADAELLAAVARRDGAAFSAFYRRHLAEVLAYLVRETGDSELAADLAAEVFAAVLLSAARYEAQAVSALPWVIGIARHKLLMSWRRGRVDLPLGVDWENKPRQRGLGSNRSSSTTSRSSASSSSRTPASAASSRCSSSCRRWSARRCAGTSSMRSGTTRSQSS